MLACGGCLCRCTSQKFSEENKITFFFPDFAVGSRGLMRDRFHVCDLAGRSCQAGHARKTSSPRRRRNRPPLRSELKNELNNELFFGNFMEISQI